MWPQLLPAAVFAFGCSACGVLVDASSYVDGESSPGQARLALIGGMREPSGVSAAPTAEVLVGLAGESGEIQRYLPMPGLPKPGLFAAHAAATVTVIGATSERAILVAQAPRRDVGLGAWQTLGEVEHLAATEAPLFAMLSESSFAVLGGHPPGGDAVATVQLGHPTSDGVIFPEPSASLSRARWLAATVVCQGALYVIGGLAGGSGAPETLASVERAAVTPEGLGPFSETLAMLSAGQPHAVAALAATCHRDRLLVVGGNRERGLGQTVTSVLSGALDASGEITAWSDLAPLPVPLSGAAIAVSGGRLWVLGGTLEGGLSRSDRVHSAPLGDDGLGAWTSSPAGALPDGRSDMLALPL